MSEINLKKTWELKNELEIKQNRKLTDKELISYLGVKVKDKRFWKFFHDGDVLECWTVLSAHPIYLSKSFFVATSYTESDLFSRSAFDLYERDEEIQSILSGVLIQVAMDDKVYVDFPVNNFLVKETEKERRTLRLNYKAAVGVSYKGHAIGVATCLKTDVISKGKNILKPIDS